MALENKKDEAFLGLAHYRRYFNFLNYSFVKPHRINIVQMNNEIFKKHIEKEHIIKSRILKWLKNYDVILPYKRGLKNDHQYISITQEYCLNHIENDWNVTMQIILEKYPDYQKSIKKHLDNNNKIFLMNMFVSNRKFVDDYCSWLFDILFEVEKRISFSDDAYQKRVFGFISERLFTLYIFHNKLKVKELPLLFIKDYF